MAAHHEKFKKIEIVAPTAGLSPGYLKALDSLKKVAPIFNKIFLNQVYKDNEELLKGIEAKKECNGVIEEFFLLNYGPWNRIDRNLSFIPYVTIKKPLGANFYPLDMTTDEFEKYLLTLSPVDKLKAKGPHFVIKSIFHFFFKTFSKGNEGTKELFFSPYSKEHNESLVEASTLLKEASEHIDNISLKKFLSERADALLTNDYRQSEISWIDVDVQSKLEVTVGPYEKNEGKTNLKGFDYFFQMHCMDPSLLSLFLLL
jgi:hypothetical protein